MKKILASLTVLLLIALFVLPVQAATLQVGDDYTLGQEDRVLDNFYAVGGNVNISGDIGRDLLVVAGDIVVSGNIGDDALLIGGSVGVFGEIEEDLRIAGGSVTIGENVGGDVFVGGGTVHVLPGVEISGDLIVGAGKVVIDGTVNGDVKLGGGEIVINGTVDGDVSAKISKKFIISSEAVVKGDVVYYGPREAKISDEASIGGAVEFNRISASSLTTDIDIFSKGIFTIVGIFLFVKLFALLLAGIIGVRLFRNDSKLIVDRSLTYFWKELLRGFIVLIIVPIVSILLLLTLVGSIVGIFLMLAYVLTLVMASIYSGIIFGSWVLKYITKSKSYVVDWKSVLLGITLLYFIGIIPLIGWLIQLVFFLIALGAISYTSYKKSR